MSDVLVETMINWGVTHVFGMVGHSNLGFADAMREAEKKGYRELWGVVGFAERINQSVTDIVGWITTTTGRRIAVVVGFTGGRRI